MAIYPHLVFKRTSSENAAHSLTSIRKDRMHTLALWLILQPLPGDTCDSVAHLYMDTASGAKFSTHNTRMNVVGRASLEKR